MAARLSALRAGPFLPPGRFLVLISVRVDYRAIVRLEELGKLKKSTSSGIRTGDLPACSIVPQPTTLPRAPWGNSKKQKKKLPLPAMLSFELSTWFLTSNGRRESQSSTDNVLFQSLSLILYVLVLAADFFFVSHTKVL
jgi:hypothetical protein